MFSAAILGKNIGAGFTKDNSKTYVTMHSVNAFCSMIIVSYGRLTKGST